MKQLYALVSILLLLSAMPAGAKGFEAVHHDLIVTLYPTEQRFTATNTVTIPGDMRGDLRFDLHAGLNPISLTPGVQLVAEHQSEPVTNPVTFRVTLPPGLSSFSVAYGGVIRHPLEAPGQDYARGIKQTPGIISPQGVYLAGSSFWYPAFKERMASFSLQVALPAGWRAVSQGKRTLNHDEEDKTLVRWESRQPQEEIYLVAARFTEYIRSENHLTSMVFLRSPDENLANKYLKATGRYVAMYEKLIGPYPYDKFALIENFWESGFGMPSFTLLGSRVIRFPFILHSSYPHEILHNWWGNGVVPDYRQGNWSEGLTAYLSDHLIKVQRGSGKDYRQATLQKYTDYVLSERDFPLTQFRSRHSATSEAVGYGKALMFFHMLRRELTDEIFVKGLQAFYQTYKFQSASFEELQRSFETVSAKNLNVTFDQWITRTGAPELVIRHTQVTPKDAGYILLSDIKQVQPGPAYRLQIPVAVTMEGRTAAFQTEAHMDLKRLKWQVTLPARPLRLDVDPGFDLFRRLNRDEIPPALTQMFGASQLLILLPSAADKDRLSAYHKFSQALGRASSGQVTIELDSKFETLPQDRTIAILGWENRFRTEMITALTNYNVTADRNSVRIGQTVIQRHNHAVVLTARRSSNKDLSLTWVASDRSEALTGLGRKLPHYHKYSYLGFDAIELANFAKGRWPIIDSPMTVFLKDDTGNVSKVEMAALSPPEPLATLPPDF